MDSPGGFAAIDQGHKGLKQESQVYAKYAFHTGRQDILLVDQTQVYWTRHADVSFPVSQSGTSLPTQSLRLFDTSC